MNLFSSKYLYVLGVVVLLIGCVDTVKPQSANNQQNFIKYLRGTVYLENSQYELRLCGSSSIVKLLDPNNKLISHIYENNKIIPSMYVEFKAKTVNILDWQLEQLFFISKKPKKCSDKVLTLEYLVTAVEGDWQAEIKDNQVNINKRNIFTPLAFVSSEDKWGHWSGEMLLPKGIRFNMEIVLRYKDCIDALDQWYSLSATLKINREVLEGCARTGGRVESFVSGKYSNLLTVDDAFIVLNLNEDNSAALILDYRSGHPLVVNRGHWKMLENQVIALNLPAASHQLQGSAMLFQVFDNKELRLKGFSELLGGAGLRLLPLE